MEKLVAMAAKAVDVRARALGLSSTLCASVATAKTPGKQWKLQRRQTKRECLCFLGHLLRYVDFIPYM
jgi:hypothetical protein